MSAFESLSRLPRPMYKTAQRGVAGRTGSEDVSQVPVRPAAPLWAVLYIGRGKRDKLSKADIVGFLCKKGGLRSAQIGHIELAAHTAYVAIERRALSALLKQVAGEKIKGMKTIIEEMRQ